MSDENKLPPCDPEVFENGESAGLYDGFDKEDVERLCKSLSQITGWRIDWSYFAGRPHIRALPPVDQHQGEPVAWLAKTLKGGLAGTLGLARYDQKLNPDLYEGPFPVFRHADPGEVEALQKHFDDVLESKELDCRLARGEADTLRAQLSERDALLVKANYVIDHARTIDKQAFARGTGNVDPGLFRGLGNLLSQYDDALSASAEPSAPAEHDERSAFERAYHRHNLTRDYLSGLYVSSETRSLFDGWMSRAALEGSKPTVLSKCVLCDQLQADLTALDEKLDQTQDLLRCMVYDYRSVVQAGYDRITALGSDCDSVAKMLDDNPNYQKALALLLPDLESRPEERGTPETEPCSGCGTPGWTGACNKCVPY